MLREFKASLNVHFKTKVGLCAEALGVSISLFVSKAV